jgi:DNA-binding NarL/FixJ family response regulator
VEDNGKGGQGFFAIANRVGGFEEHPGPARPLRPRHHARAGRKRSAATSKSPTCRRAASASGSAFRPEGASSRHEQPPTVIALPRRPIRVLLVDDHTLFRKGLAELLEQRGTIKVAGIAGNGDDALRILAEARPDVIITDLNMPPNGGLSLLRQLVADGWNGPVLVLTVSDAEEDLAAAMQAGAKGYLLKDMEPEDVVDAVQRAVRGETVVAPAMTLKLVNLLQGGNAARPRPTP